MPPKNRKINKNIAKKYTQKAVLIIEDDDFLLNMYKTKLEMGNYKVLTAKNGDVGLRLIKEKKPDLILLDIILPKINGFKIIEQIKSDNTLKQVPIIILTNLGQKDEVQKALDLGANEYLIKTHFLPSEVVSKIERVLKG